MRIPAIIILVSLLLFALLFTPSDGQIVLGGDFESDFSFWGREGESSIIIFSRDSGGKAVQFLPAGETLTLAGVIEDINPGSRYVLKFDFAKGHWYKLSERACRRGASVGGW